MNSSCIRRTSVTALLVAGTIALTGCGKYGSGAEGEAAKLVMAEVKKSWLKTGEGWITVYTFGYAGEKHYYVQLRELSIEEIKSVKLSDSDRMNGFEWKGLVTFKKTPRRQMGGLLISDSLGSPERPPDVWSQWEDYRLQSIRVTKFKGKWQVETDTWLSGRRPDHAP